MRIYNSTINIVRPARKGNDLTRRLSHHYRYYQHHQHRVTSSSILFYSFFFFHSVHVRDGIARCNLGDAGRAKYLSWANETRPWLAWETQKIPSRVLYTQHTTHGEAWKREKGKEEANKLG